MQSDGSRWTVAGVHHGARLHSQHLQGRRKLYDPLARRIGPPSGPQPGRGAGSSCVAHSARAVGDVTLASELRGTDVTKSLSADTALSPSTTNTSWPSETTSWSLAMSSLAPRLASN